VRLSKGEEHGVRLSLRLAEAGCQLTVGELAARERLPEPTVAKVLLALRRGGVVEAERGRQGGYELARPAEETSVRAVLRALDGPLFEGSFCRREEEAVGCCVHQGECSLLPVWLQLEQVIERFLDRITLADLLHGSEGSVPTAITFLAPSARAPGVGRDEPGTR
jgi:Rrf2 family iron-sulfur cluster assembly transcriptional regulator